jgi:hypothetical protein
VGINCTININGHIGAKCNQTYRSPGIK